MRYTIIVLLLLTAVAWAYRPAFRDAAGTTRTYTGEIVFTDLQAMAGTLGSLAGRNAPKGGASKLTTPCTRVETVTAAEDGSATLTWADTVTEAGRAHTNTTTLARTAAGRLSLWVPDKEKIAKAGNDPTLAEQRAYQKRIDHLDGMGVTVLLPDKEIAVGDSWRWTVMSDLPAKLLDGRQEQAIESKLVKAFTDNGRTYLQIESHSRACLTPQPETKGDTTVTQRTEIAYNTVLLFCLESGEIVKTLFHNVITVSYATKEGLAPTRTKRYTYHQDGNFTLTPTE
jgi:hypothetical protein